MFRVRIETHFGGNFEATGEIIAFISTDPAHLPWRITAPFALGSLFANLTDYKAGQSLARPPATGSRVPSGVVVQLLTERKIGAGR